jgi:acetyltransferase-like isoleucine patch superfamily enzyme
LNVSSLPTEADLRRQRFDFCPWFFPGEATAPEIADQLAYQALLQKTYGVTTGPGSFLSPQAAIIGSPGEAFHLGKDGFVAGGAYITGDVTLGDQCTVNPYATLRGKFRGGHGVRIGAYACIVGFNHGFARIDIPIHEQPHNAKGIVLGDDVWVGANVTIVDGVTVGSHTILAAGAVVTKDIPDYAIVGGNPAKILRMRNAAKPARDQLPELLRGFDARIREQIPALLRNYQATTDSGALCYVNQPGLTARVRPWNDAVEVAAAFGLVPDSLPREQWIATLSSFQDKATGLVPEHIAEYRQLNPPPAKQPHFEDMYNTMGTNYALECLGAHLPHPVATAENITPELLREVLPGLDWAQGAWGAGHWIDCYASCLCANRRHFGLGRHADTLFAWLDQNCDPKSGLWGQWRKEDRWLQPVNGFYRLTRGTYAQFGRPLPHPAAAIDTILLHTGDAEFFAAGRGNACNILDVVHPLWLCLKQSAHRRAEAEQWIAARLPLALERWSPNRGLAFDPAATDASGQPSLQGTEMWLSIIYLMADLLGLAGNLSYRPRGIHRLEPVLADG